MTGVSRFLGSCLAGRLAARDDVRRVIGVDAVTPDAAAAARIGAAEFTRIDIRDSAIVRFIADSDVDTVVHASASMAPAAAAARSMTKEMNVLGSMQLVAACGRAPRVRRLVVRSTNAVYGGSARDPSIFTETMTPRTGPTSSAARDAADIEGYARSLARRRDDIAVAIPRFAEIIGPTVTTPLTRYFSLRPTVPVALGYDARVQFVHERDAVDLLEVLTLGDFRGPVNVAGDGTLTLHQAIHRAGRVPLPIPMPAMDAASHVLRLARVGAFATQQLRLLTSARVLDTTLLATKVGFHCRYSTQQAFDDFARTLRPALSATAVRAGEMKLLGLVGMAPEPSGNRESADDGTGGDETADDETAGDGSAGDGSVDDDAPRVALASRVAPIRRQATSS